MTKERHAARRHDHRFTLKLDVMQLESLEARKPEAQELAIMVLGSSELSVAVEEELFSQFLVVASNHPRGLYMDHHGLP